MFSLLLPLDDVILNVLLVFLNDVALVVRLEP